MIIHLHPPTHPLTWPTKNSTSTRKHGPSGLKFCRWPHLTKLTSTLHSFNPTVFWGGGSYILPLGLTLPVFFRQKIFRTQLFLTQKFFWCQIFFNQKIFYPKIFSTKKKFFDPKFCLTRMFFLTQKFSDQNIVLPENFVDQNFFNQNYLKT